MSSNGVKKIQKRVICEVSGVRRLLNTAALDRAQGLLALVCTCLSRNPQHACWARKGP